MLLPLKALRRSVAVGATDSVAGGDDYIEGLGRRQERWSAQPASSVAAMSLTAEEGYLVSRLAGGLQLGDIPAASGLQEARCFELLRALKSKGAIAAEAQLPAVRSRVGAQGVVTGATPGAGRYATFMFDLVALSEDVDLELERKKEILYLCAQMEKGTYYDLLGVSVAAGAAEVKQAYLERSRSFHPDRFFRKRLGSFNGRVQELFRAVNEAYETLRDDALRAEYDQLHAKRFNVTAKSALDERQHREAEDRRREEERFARLRRTKGFGRIAAVRELLQQAAAFEAEDEIFRAAEVLKAAVELDPNSELVRARLGALRPRLDKKRADNEVRRGITLASGGEDDRALQCFRAAVEIEKDHVRANHELGVRLAARGEWRAARGYLERSAALAPRSGKVRVLLGECLLECGEKPAARKVLTEAMALEPDSKINTLLRRC